MLNAINTFIPLALGLAGAANAWSSDEMRSKSVYQVITDRFATDDGSTTTACDVNAKSYCGGTWKGLSNKLDYIQGMGFDTVWISPIVANIGGNTSLGDSYHGYWTSDIEQLNSRFGSEQDLKDLVSSAKTKGMGIMVDVVVNHVAATSSGDFTPNETYGPFNATSSFHRPFCWVDDYNNQTNVEDCSLGDTTVTLQDLDTENPYVISTFNSWITNLISTYGFEAIRIDTVKHVPKTFWTGFVDAAGVFAVGEVLDGDATYVSGYQADVMDSVFNYPIYYPLTAAFNSTSGNMTALSNMISTVSSTFKDSTLLGNFLDNHDNPRFESTNTDASLIKNAATFPFVTDGIPYLYYGQEQGFIGGKEDYLNREAMWPSAYKTDTDLYKHFTKLNAARSAAGNHSSSFFSTKATVQTNSANEIGISKSPMFAVLSNRGASSGSNQMSWSNTGLDANTQMLEVVSCQTVNTGSGGSLDITMKNGAPQVFVPASYNGDNAICSSTSDATTSGDKGGAMAAAGMPALAGVLVIAAGVGMTSFF